jgi:hypothetical protein
LRRREVLRLRAAGAVASTLAGCKLPSYSLEHGLFNRCAPPGRHPVTGERLVRAAWEGIDASRVWDCHARLFGNGRSGAGIYLSAVTQANRSEVLTAILEARDWHGRLLSGAGGA